MANINLQEGYPSPDTQFVNENYLPAHSKTIFVDGLYQSDFSPFIGRAGDRIDLSMNSGAPICQPADIVRNAGDTNVITYQMARGMITEAMVNYRGQRLGLEEELWQDRAQVPLFSVEKLGSLGEWQGNYMAFNDEFLKVKPHLLAAYTRATDWMFYRTLLHNDNAALQIIESPGVSTPALDYFTSTTSKFSPHHLETARWMAQVGGLTAPSVYSKAGGKVRRQQFPILLLDLMVEDFSNDPDILNIIHSTAQGGNYDTAFEKLVASYLTWDLYAASCQNGQTGHMGHPLWPMAVHSGPAVDYANYDAAVAALTGAAGDSLVMGLDTSTDDRYLEAALRTDWLRDWGQTGSFWISVDVSEGDSGATYTGKSLLRCTYGGGNPANGHDHTSFYGVKVEGHDQFPGTPSDPLTGNEADATYPIRISPGNIYASPYGYALGMAAHSIIYAPAPGESPSYTYEAQDYATRRGVRLAGMLYFGPRMNWQRAILGPLVMRFKMDYPYLIDGAALYPKLTGGGKNESYYGIKPYLGQSTPTSGTDTYEMAGSSGDGQGDYSDPQHWIRTEDVNTGEQGKP